MFFPSLIRLPRSLEFAWAKSSVRNSVANFLYFFCLWLVCLPARSETPPKLVDIHIDTQVPLATINKNIYGQFAEHLGRGIYEGIWVGPESNIANEQGFRKDVLQALKDLHVPLVRWPGGCFADEYHWQDGIGPRDQRKITVNTTWGGVTDDNAFGTHEFFQLAELLGAETYVNGNLGTGSPKEMAQWLEYMTSDSQSSLAQLRRANGRDKPWKLDYFAIGNEAWGCGGTMRPQYYADLYRHYATFLKTPADNTPKFIASGGHTEQTQWTETLITQVPKTWSLKMDAISHHYYTLPTGDWAKKGEAVGFSEQEWLSTFANTLKVEDYIKANLKVLEAHDPENTVGFYVDEWGTWYDTPSGANPGFLYQQNTLRDALVAALNLNVFHKYAKRIQMTNIAQMVNVLQAMILTDKEAMLLTPTYYVYKMYVPFQGAQSLAVSINNNPEYKLGDISIDQISASAALDKEGKLVLALVNTHPKQAIDLKLSADIELKRASAEILSAKKMDAENEFNKKEEVKPKLVQLDLNKSKGTVRLPSKSVTVLHFNLD